MLDSTSILFQNLHGAEEDVFAELTAPHGIAEVWDLIYLLFPYISLFPISFGIYQRFFKRSSEQLDYSNGNFHIYQSIWAEA